MGRRSNPFRGVIDTMSEMARMREYAAGGGQEEGRRTHATAWVPTTDIFSVGDDLVIRCELAGVEPEDVEVSLSNGALSIDGERTDEPDASSSYYARERCYGHFRRRLTLPEDIDGSRISASFQNGLLEVTVRGGVDYHEPERIQIEHSPAGETSIRTQ